MIVVANVKRRMGLFGYHVGRRIAAQRVNGRTARDVLEEVDARRARRGARMHRRRHLAARPPHLERPGQAVVEPLSLTQPDERWRRRRAKIGGAAL